METVKKERHTMERRNTTDF